MINYILLVISIFLFLLLRYIYMGSFKQIQSLNQMMTTILFKHKMLNKPFTGAIYGR
jgi:hypothetical protein